MRQFLVLVALSVLVSLTFTAAAVAITRSDRFRALRTGEDPEAQQEAAA